MWKNLLELCVLSAFCAFRYDKFHNDCSVLAFECLLILLAYYVSHDFKLVVPRTEFCLTLHNGPLLLASWGCSLVVWKEHVVLPLLMRSKHIGRVVKGSVSCNKGYCFLPALCLILLDKNNFFGQTLTLHNNNQCVCLEEKMSVTAAVPLCQQLAACWCLFSFLLLHSLIILCLFMCVPMWLTIKIRLTETVQKYFHQMGLLLRAMLKGQMMEMHREGVCKLLLYNSFISSWQGTWGQLMHFIVFKDRDRSCETVKSVDVCWLYICANLRLNNFFYGNKWSAL